MLRLAAWCWWRATGLVMKRDALDALSGLERQWAQAVHKSRGLYGFSREVASHEIAVAGGVLRDLHAEMVKAGHIVERKV